MTDRLLARYAVFLVAWAVRARPPGDPARVAAIAATGMSAPTVRAPLPVPAP